MAGSIALIDIYQAEGVVTIPLVLLDDGAPLDITGWALSARLGLANERDIITKTIDEGINVTDAAAGELNIVFSEVDLNRVARVYLFELRRTGEGTERVLVTGTLALRTSLFGGY